MYIFLCFSYSCFSYSNISYICGTKILAVYFSLLAIRSNLSNIFFLSLLSYDFGHLRIGHTALFLRLFHYGG